MSPHTPTNDRETSDDGLGLQAAEWLLRLTAEKPDPDEIYQDPAALNAAFIAWLRLSTQHLKIFLQTFEMHRRLQHLDAQGEVKVESLIANSADDVISLFASPERQDHELRPPSPVMAQDRQRPRPRWISWGVAATLMASAALGVLSWFQANIHVYATAIGEQRTSKLEDGSFITLNADSRAEVDFSSHERNIRLVRGEALFAVAHDSTRPFWVRTNTAAVRAVGTQFNVRRLRDESTDVSVVEGVVQVTATDVPPHPTAGQPQPSHGDANGAAQVGSTMPLRLAAGEEAQVAAGKVQKSGHPSVANALAWRQRRLVFHDAELQEIAAEFNRYNRIQVVVDGPAREKRFSGIFDADHPESLILYAAKDEDLFVQPEGNNWLILAR